MSRFVRILMILSMSWLASGCDPGTEHDAAVDYTPESLAQELAFRYRDLSPSAKKASKNRSAGVAKAIEATEREAVAKGRSKTATKQAQAETLDDVLDEIGDKARAIRGVSTAESLHKISEAIGRDSSLDEGDRQALAEKLDEMAPAERDQ